MKILVAWRISYSYQQVLPQLSCSDPVNTSAPGKDICHFTDDIFRCIFVNEKFCILIRISVKFVLMCPINKIPALVQIMTWCWIGNKPLSEPMVTRFTDAYMQHSGRWVKYKCDSMPITHIFIKAEMSFMAKLTNISRVAPTQGLLSVSGNGIFMVLYNSKVTSRSLCNGLVSVV